MKEAKCTHQNGVFQVDVRLLIPIQDHDRVPQKVLVVHELVVFVGLVNAVMAVPDDHGGSERGDEDRGHASRHVRAVGVPDAEPDTSEARLIAINSVHLPHQFFMVIYTTTVL